MHLRVRQGLERLLGLRIHEELPLGVDVHYDLRRLPFFDRTGVLLDIGANEGQTARRFAKLYPRARILSFEPAPAMLARLRERTRHLRNVTSLGVALGSVRGSAELYVHECSTCSTLRADLRHDTGYSAQPEQVTVRTLDDVLAEEKIESVQYAKIDTEGFDMEVLKGAAESLRAGRIAFVEVECGFEQDEKKFVPLEQCRVHLREYGYLIFGLYEQVHQSGRPVLRRCNAVFVAERLLAR